MAVNIVYKLQQIMSFLVLAAVIVAGVQCSNSNHESEERSATHDHDGNGGPVTPRIKAQSRISMNKNGYGARIQIREDLHGRKHAHAMAVCDCNGQGPWRPLFKASQILRTEFPEHESFHEEVDSQFRNLVTEQVDNQLRSALSGSSSQSSSSPSSSSSENSVSGSDSGGGSYGGGSYGGGSSGGGLSSGGGFSSGGHSFGTGFNGVGGVLPKKLNHMIHLHLIPHIYVPVMHTAGYSEAKNYQASEEERPRSPVYQHSSVVNSSPELFQSVGGNSDVSGSGGGVGVGGDSLGDVSGGETGPSSTSGPIENPAIPSTAAGGDPDHGSFNGHHSGETTYYTITEDTVQHIHHDLNEPQGNAIDNHNHEYEAPSSAPASEEPHQYQVHEMDDLSKDYSSKKHVTTSGSGGSGASSSLSGNDNKSHKHRNSVTTGQGGKPGRSKHARKLSSRQDLKNLLVMRPPPVGQTQTWRYVYHHHQRPAVAATRHHQFFQRKLPPPPPMVPVLKSRTVPLILHIRQRSDD